MQSRAREPLRLPPLLSSSRASVLEAAHAETLFWKTYRVLEFFNGQERYTVGPDMIR